MDAPTEVSIAFVIWREQAPLNIWTCSSSEKYAFGGMFPHTICLSSLLLLLIVTQTPHFHALLHGNHWNAGSTVITAIAQSVFKCFFLTKMTRDTKLVPKSHGYRIPLLWFMSKWRAKSTVEHKKVQCFNVSFSWQTHLQYIYKNKSLEVVNLSSRSWILSLWAVRLICFSVAEEKIDTNY